MGTPGLVEYYVVPFIVVGLPHQGTLGEGLTLVHVVWPTLHHADEDTYDVLTVLYDTHS